MLLEVKNLSKAYSKKLGNTIKDINLYGNGGEIVGILGHNGAGKSTTIKSITGIHPYEGTIKICGYDLAKQSIEAKKNFGYVSDEFSLFEKMTGRKYEYLKGLNGHFELALYVEHFEDVDKRFEELVNKGARPVLEPTTEPWGQRTCYIADPEGNLIEIGSFNRPFER